MKRTRAAATVGALPGRGTLLTGPALFARYAYPPNALGYCGPGDPAALLDMTSEGADATEVRRLAPQFEGAWPYLRLIASSAGIFDPLDPQVVEAYWTGNELVTRVDPAELGKSLRDRFSERAGRHMGAQVPVVPNGVAQHSFHVFAVYPWLGLLRAGGHGAPLEILDRCRVRWGRVEAVAGDLVTVRNRRLRFDGSRLTLGHEQVEQARRGISGRAMVSDLEPGDTVSLHWDWVCDRLSPASCYWLRYCTMRNLEAVNVLARRDPPDPGGACLPDREAVTAEAGTAAGSELLQDGVKSP